MSQYYLIFAFMTVYSSAFAYVNHRFIRLPFAIGLMMSSMFISLLILVFCKFFPGAFNFRSIISSIDLPQILLGSMLSFMLFAGALPLRLDILKEQKVPVVAFSTISVIISTFLIGLASFSLLKIFGINVSLINCMMFGAIISPTDPLAVLSILRQAKIPTSVEMQLSGESLFNDGMAIVVFLAIQQAAKVSADLHWQDVLILFFRQSVGGIFLGYLLGWAGSRLIGSVNDYKVEVMISIGVVMGGYSIATLAGTSGPLAMVMAGIMIGNYRKQLGTNTQSRVLLEKFWEIADYILNALLFAMMGFELLLIHFERYYLVVGLICIVIALGVRYFSLYVPVLILKMQKTIGNKTLLLLTWGGLRGGLSIALALSLQPGQQKDLWITLTYIVVSFSILVQGLTISKLARYKRIEQDE